MKRITLICASFLAILLSACNQHGAALLNGLPEDEANSIVAILKQSGIGATKTLADDGSANIYVAGDSQSAALSELYLHGLPRKNYASLGEIFKKDGIISTPLEEQARYVYALAQELEKTLSRLDGVVYVRVHPVLARKASLNGPAANASAGVLIKHLPDADLAYLTPQIQELVAHSIPELQADRVSIILAVAEPSSVGGMGNANNYAPAHARSAPVWWQSLLGVLITVAACAYVLRNLKSKPKHADIAAVPASLETNESHE